MTHEQPTTHRGSRDAWPSLARRTFLGAVAAAAATAVTAVPGATTPRSRPNILCLVSEDCGAEHLGCYGGVAQTPTLDALAAQGVRWQNSFAAAPVCAPSRFSMITGLPSESCPPANQMRAAAELPPELRGAGWPRLLRQAGYYCTNNAKEDYNTADLDIAATWDESSTTAHWRNRPSDAPFFAIFNINTTHEMSVVTDPAAFKGLAELAQGHKVGDLGNAAAFMPPPPPTGPTTPEEVRIPPYYPDTATTRADAALYMNRIHQMDAEVVALLTELDEAGLADNTIVLYYSDHGGVLPRSKRFCYDSGLRVPLIARFGRNVAHLSPAPAGSVLDEPVCTGTALPPTILDLTGVGVAPWMTGTPFAGVGRSTTPYAFGMRNRMDGRNDMVRTVRDHRFRYIRNYLPHLPNGQYVDFQMMQAGYQEWLSLYQQGELNDLQSRFWRPRPAEELFDIRSDPHETVNLATDSAYASELGRLSTALDEHMLAVNDGGFIPEGHPAEHADIAHQADIYPLRNLMDLAAVAIRRDPATIPTLTDALRSDNDIVRYWAATGICMLDTVGAPAAAALRTVFTGERSVHAKIAVAQALTLAAGNPEALGYLGELLVNHPDGRVRLQAANSLAHLGDRAAPALQALQAAATDTTATREVRQVAAHTVDQLTGER